MVRFGLFKEKLQRKTLDLTAFSRAVHLVKRNDSL
jgi:hypothetical protein